jgi:hypothetical protein
MFHIKGKDTISTCTFLQRQMGIGRASGEVFYSQWTFKSSTTINNQITNYNAFHVSVSSVEGLSRSGGSGFCNTQGLQLPF